MEPDDFSKLAPQLATVSTDEIDVLIGSTQFEDRFEPELRVVVGMTEMVVVADVLRDTTASSSFDIVYSEVSRLGGAIISTVRVRSTLDDDGWVTTSVVGEAAPRSRMPMSAVDDNIVCTGCVTVDLAMDVLGGWRCLATGGFMGCLVKAAVGEVIIGTFCEVGPCASGHRGRFWQPGSYGCDQSACHFYQYVKDRRDGVPVTQLDSQVYWHHSLAGHYPYDIDYWSLSQYERLAGGFRMYYWNHASLEARGSDTAVIYLGVVWADGSFMYVGAEYLPTGKPPPMVCPRFAVCV